MDPPVPTLPLAAKPVEPCISEPPTPPTFQKLMPSSASSSASASASASHHHHHHHQHQHRTPPSMARRRQLPPTPPSASCCTTIRTAKNTATEASGRRHALPLNRRRLEIPSSPPPFSPAASVTQQQTTLQGRVLFPQTGSSATQTSSQPYKTVYLIRHGESLGQCASTGQQRRTDPTLLDCALSQLGEEQARNIPAQLGLEVYASIDLIVCSPLTRAIQTTLLAFTTSINNGLHTHEQKPIICHYDLREVGSMVPENIPRSTNAVQHDMEKWFGYSKVDTMIDFESLRPANWPRRHDTPPKVVRRHRVQQVFVWLATHRSESTIAVVCHYHVIKAALANPYQVPVPSAVDKVLHPPNAIPIRCILYPDGQLVLASPPRT